MLVHDFIIVDVIPEPIKYSAFNKSAMTHISDDFILEYWDKVFGAVDVFCDVYGNLKHGIAYHGTSILTPEMSMSLLKLMEQVDRCHEDCSKLKHILSEAVNNKKFLLHFGI